MEELNQLWAWLKEQIIPLLTSANIALVVGVLVKIIRQKVTLKDVSVSSTELKKTLSANKDATEKQNGLARRVEELTEAMAYMTQKEDAILDILNTVYSSSQSLTPNVKSAVSELYAGNRFATTKARKEALKLAEEMKVEAAENAEKAAKKVESVKKLLI
jgi:hypothetical protein